MLASTAMGRDFSKSKNRLNRIFDHILGDKILGRWQTNGAWQRRWLRLQVGVIAAIEHVTCVLGSWILENRAVGFLTKSFLRYVKWGYHLVAEGNEPLAEATLKNWKRAACNWPVIRTKNDARGLELVQLENKQGIARPRLKLIGAAKGVVAGVHQHIVPRNDGTGAFDGAAVTRSSLNIVN